MQLQHLIDRLEQFCDARGAVVIRTTLGTHVMGRCQSGRILLRRGLSKERQLLTLVHEITHLLVHQPADPRIDRTICEYEAVAVERLVGWQLGLRSCTAEGESAANFTDDLLACSVARVKQAVGVLETAFW